MLAKLLNLVGWFNLMEEETLTHLESKIQKQKLHFYTPPTAKLFVYLICT